MIDLVFAVLSWLAPWLVGAYVVSAVGWYPWLRRREARIRANSTTHHVLVRLP